MKNNLRCILVGGASLVLVIASDAAGKPISPEMRISYKIVDEAGVPVPDVSCRGWIREFDSKGGGYSYSLISDTNGILTISGRCSVSFTAFFTKEGYYTSRLEPCLDMDGTGSFIVDGKWQPYGEILTVVLKKIKNPYAVKVLSGVQCHRRIPKFDEWIGFDFEQGDWLQPYGRGMNEDVLVRFKSSVRKHQMDYTHVMEVSFTNNPYAGFYQKKKDASSDLKSDYFANSNAVFETGMVCIQEKLEKCPRRWDFLDKDSYLVFRTRTRIDENGNLKAAHYGKIYGYWCSDDKEMTFGGGCFNPVENDTNIEGDQSLLYKVRNYKDAK